MLYRCPVGFRAYREGGSGEFGALSGVELEADGDGFMMTAGVVRNRRPRIGMFSRPGTPRGLAGGIATPRRVAGKTGIFPMEVLDVVVRAGAEERKRRPIRGS